MTDLERLADLFPQVEPPVSPAGYKVLVQLVRVPEKTRGGIILANETKDADQAVAVFAKVLAIGPAAFRNRSDGSPWPGAPWVEVGQYVRVPRYGGDRHKIDGIPYALLSDEEVLAVVKDLSIIQ